jgi:predicted double-glycine peptidase
VKASLIWLGAMALGCASYQGTARDVASSQVAAEQGWRRIDGVELVRQKGTKDCGAAALSMVLEYWESAPNAGAERTAIDAALRQSAGQGLLAGELRDYARQQGFQAYVFAGTLDDIRHEIEAQRPVIVGVHKPLSSREALAHYEVVIGLHPERELVLTLDPAHGLRENQLSAFLSEWEDAGHTTLVVMR